MLKGTIIFSWHQLHGVPERVMVRGYEGRKERREKDRKGRKKLRKQAGGEGEGIVDLGMWNVMHIYSEHTCR